MSERGRIALAEAIGTLILVVGGPGTAVLATGGFFPKGSVGVLGVAWGEYLHQVPGSAALFAWGLGQLVSLGLKPPPPQRYPLSEGRPALQALADGGVFGKLVLEP